MKKFLFTILLFALPFSVYAEDILYTEVTQVGTISRLYTTGGLLGCAQWNDSAVPNYAVTRVQWTFGNLDSDIQNGSNFVYARIRDDTGTVFATSTEEINFDAGAGVYTFEFDTPVLLQDIDTTDVRVCYQTVSDGSIAQKTFDTYVSGADNYDWDYFDTSGNATTSDPIMTIWGFDLDDPVDGGGTNPRIIEQISPLNGEQTASTLVNFQFSYYNDDTVGYAGAEIKDLTAGFEYAPIEEASLASGQNTFSQYEQLAEGHLHLWRPYLRTASSTTPFVFGSWYSFEVVSDSASSSPYIPFDPDGSLATSTVVGRFFSNQGLLASRPPFSYFYDVAGYISQLDSSDTESSFPVLALDFSSSSLPMGTLTLLSSSTVSSFAGSSSVSLFRTLMAAAIWLAFGSMVFFQVKHLFKHH